MIPAEHSVVMQDNKFRVYSVGDMHCSLRSFDERRFKRFIQHIVDDPAGVAVVMGDVSDARSREHKFFAPQMIHPRFHIEDIDILEDKVAEYAADLLAPLGDKLIGFLRGNHHQAGFTHTLRREYRARTNGVNPVDLGDRCMVRLRLYNGRDKAEGSYIIFAQHRTSGGRKPGAQLNQQIDNMSSFDADLYLYAHSHKPLPYRPNRYKLQRRGKLQAIQERPLIITSNAWIADATFGSNSYADEMGLPTTSDLVYYADVRWVRTTDGMRAIAKPVAWD